MSALSGTMSYITRPCPTHLLVWATLRFASMVICVAVVLAVSGCGQSAGQSAPAAPPPEVKIAQPVRQKVREWDYYPGRIEAMESVEIRARVDGYLEKVNFKAGDRVKKGDLLFVIDPRPFQAELERTRAQLEQAQARLELSQSNFARAERLIGKNFVTREEYDIRRSEVKEAEAAVRSAEAEVKTAELNLEFTHIRSPIDGMVGRELIDEGNLVRGGGADATVLTFVVSVDPVHVYVDVDEKLALKYRNLARQGRSEKTGSGGSNTPEDVVSMEIGLASETGFPHRGYIDYESPRLDITTGTLNLRGVFADPDGLLKPGLFARVRIPATEAPYQAILLPNRAITSNLAQKVVWVLDKDNQVSSRQVELGPVVEGLRVIRQGLKQDEWVVVEGIQKLREGIKVNPQRINLASIDER